MTWGGYTSSGITWGTTTSATTVWPGTFTVQSAPVAPAKKRTPTEWLEDEVERICAMTRAGLVSA